GVPSGPLRAPPTGPRAAGLATAPRRSARLTAGFLAVWAPLTVFQRPWLATAAGLVGAAAATPAARPAPPLGAGPDQPRPAGRPDPDPYGDRAATRPAGATSERGPGEIPILAWLCRQVP